VHQKVCGDPNTKTTLVLDDSNIKGIEDFEEEWLLVWRNPVLRVVLEEFVDTTTLRLDTKKFLDKFDPENRDLSQALNVAVAAEVPEGLAYDEDQRIGEGASATVYLASDTKYKRYVAKIYKRQGSNRRVQQLREGERNMLQYVNRMDPITRKGESRYVLGFFGYWPNWRGTSLLLTELIDGEDLQYLFIGKSFPRGERPRRGFGMPGLGPERYGYLSYIIPQIFMGLEFLHNKGIAHRDIKTDNIMVDIREGRTVLIDLGLSCVLDDNLMARRLLEKFSCNEEGLRGVSYFQSPELAEIYLHNYTKGSGQDGYPRQASFKARRDCDIYAASVTILRSFFGAQYPRNAEFFKEVLDLDFVFGPQPNLIDTIDTLSLPDTVANK
jgi:serine/threonine protein kinase